MSSGTEGLTLDEQRLAELGYKQELHRGWAAFSNFAISFSIISVLAGCFTTYGQAFNNGGPVAISIAWPIISMLILVGVAFPMSELASAFPTAGGIYYWASKLGGAGWGWFTGWFNLIGLVAVVASVDYVCATFLIDLLDLLQRRTSSSSLPVRRALTICSGEVGGAGGNCSMSYPIIFVARGGLINVFSSHLRLGLQRHLGLVEHVVGVGGDRADPDHRAQPPREPLLRVRAPHQRVRVR